MSQVRVINPNVDIIPIDGDGAIIGFDVKTVVKGRGRLRYRLDASDPSSSAFATLKQLLEEEPGDLNGNAWAQLAHMGILVTEAEVAQPVRFACRLDDIRESEIPARLMPASEPRSLLVNPTLRLATFDELAASNPDTSHIWEPTAEIVMVRDLRTNIEYPYWPSDASRGYVVLLHLLRGAHIVALREYYGRVLEEGFVHFRDGQVPLRYAEHSEPLMVYYHVQLRSLFEAVVGEPIRCSYPYFGAYRTGADLEKHVDREQCELTASLLIDQLPRPADLTDWPLYLEIPATGEQVAMDMGIGDGSLYKGRELPHYRLPFAGQLTTCHFYHYVKADFAGALG